MSSFFALDLFALRLVSFACSFSVALEQRACFNRAEGGRSYMSRFSYSLLYRLKKLSFFSSQY
jgi:hypothetical protein